MSKTVLVTGGTGFIGSHVIKNILKNGYDVILIKRSSSNTWRIDDIKNKIKSFDIDNYDLSEIFEENSINTILHLSTYYKKFHTFRDLNPMITSNITFPVKLLELAKKYEVESFINTGTFFEYSYKKLPITENSGENPSNFYAMSKIAFENILKSYSKKYDMNIATLKLFSPYGPYDNEEKIVPIIINSALKKEKVKLSHGLQKLDFIYVKDIAEAYKNCLENISLLEHYESINIGTGFPYSIRDIVSILEDILGESIKKSWNDPSDENMEIIYSDISKASQILRWEPKYSLKQGLEETVEYYRDKNDL